MNLKGRHEHYYMFYITIVRKFLYIAISVVPIATFQTADTSIRCRLLQTCKKLQNCKILSKLANLLIIWFNFMYKVIKSFDFNKPILQPRNLPIPIVTKFPNKLLFLIVIRLIGTTLIAIIIN